MGKLKRPDESRLPAATESFPTPFSGTALFHEYAYE